MRLLFRQASRNLAERSPRLVNRFLKSAAIAVVNPLARAALVAFGHRFGNCEVKCGDTCDRSNPDSWLQPVVRSNVCHQSRQIHSIPGDATPQPRRLILGLQDADTGGYFAQAIYEQQPAATRHSKRVSQQARHDHLGHAQADAEPAETPRGDVVNRTTASILPRLLSGAFVHCITC